jgi:YD repeat-containing protein
MNTLRSAPTAVAVLMGLATLLMVAAPRKAHAEQALRWICSSNIYSVARMGGNGSWTVGGFGCGWAWVEVGGGSYGNPWHDTMPRSGGGGENTIPNAGTTAGEPRDASQKSPCDQAGNPVVFSTGNKIEPEVDFTSAGDAGLSLTRTYNYYWNGIGIFGRRWLSNYDYKLLFTTDDPTSPCYPRPGNGRCDPLNRPIWAQRPDGRKIKFNYSTTPSPGWYEDKPSPVAKIIQTGSTYTLYSEEHTVEVYDYNGFPSYLRNEQGIGWAFTYDINHYLTRVTHSSGRHLDFGWSNGLLVTVSDPAGNIYRYSYATIAATNSLSVSPPATISTSSASEPLVSPMLMMLPDPEDPPPTPYNPPIQTMVALLTSATQPGGTATTLTYHYEDARFRTALTGKTINGLRYAWFIYDANGRVIETKHANGAERYQFAYTLDANNAITAATVTNPLGKQTTYQFNAKGDQISVTGLGSTHCAATYKETSYDSAGYPNATSDFNGNITAFTYAATGQLQQKVIAADTPLAQTIHYAWDTAHNRVIRETLEGDHETSYVYGSDGRLTSVSVKNLSTQVAASTGQTRTTTYTYTTFANGLLASQTIDGPLAGPGDATTTTYSQTGDLLTTKNSLGQTTTFDDYNGLGLPGSITGPNGDKHCYVYDARGRITDDQTYRNGGAQHTYYEYDGFGRLSRITQPDGHTHSYRYDVAGRLLSEYEPEAGGTFAQTVYAYNAMSLPTSVKKQRVFVEPARGTVP